MANQATKKRESVMQCGYKYTVAVYTGGWGMGRGVYVHGGSQR